MLKKVIPIILMLCLIFSISVMAENENPVSEETVPEVSQQMPQGAEGRPQGGQGNMGIPPSGEMPTRGTPPNMPNGKMPPEGMNRDQRPQGELAPPQTNETNNNTEIATSHGGDTSTENPQVPSGNHQFGGQMPGGMGGFPGNMQNFNGQTQEEVPTGFLGFVKTNSTPITSVILLALAFIFVIFYRRKNY